MFLKKWENRRKNRTPYCTVVTDFFQKIWIEFPPGNSRDGNSREIWDFCLSRFPGNWSGIPGKRSIMKSWHLLTMGYVDFHILSGWVGSLLKIGSLFKISKDNLKAVQKLKSRPVVGHMSWGWIALCDMDVWCVAALKMNSMGEKAA